VDGRTHDGVIICYILIANNLNNRTTHGKHGMWR